MLIFTSRQKLIKDVFLNAPKILEKHKTASLGKGWNSKEKFAKKLLHSGKWQLKIITQDNAGLKWKRAPSKNVKVKFEEPLRLEIHASFYTRTTLNMKYEEPN